jgi:hypothetical protein
MSLRVALLVLAAAAALNAQDWYPKNNFTIGGGFARPRGDIGGFPSRCTGFEHLLWTPFPSQLSKRISALTRPSALLA